MRWNWQQPDWPRFAWDAARLEKAEREFLLGAGVLLGSVEHLGEDQRLTVTIESMSREAVTTSEIEGVTLERASVQSSIRRELGLEADPKRSKPAERGVAELMVDLHRGFASPLDHATLFRWHSMVMRGTRGLASPHGAYRTHEAPMQVVSGSLDRPRVHFEAPPSARVPAEMDGFVDWFNGTASLPAVTRAGVAHLYFECIHPFEDGNGRIGRAVSEKALAQGFGRPLFTGLATAMLVRRKSYYEALERANKGNELTEWLAWFAGIAIEAQRRSIAEIEFVIEKARLLDAFSDLMNERQLAAVLRMLREGPDGFTGGMSAGKYAAITKASAPTATRDLAGLVEMGAMERTGERRHARYRLAVRTRRVGRVTVDETGNVVESAEPGPDA